MSALVRGASLAVVIATALGDAPAAVQHTDVPPVPADFHFDGRAAEWLGRSPTLALLSPSAAAPNGRLWLGTGEAGLVIAGEIRGGAPRWPRTPGEMAAADHVEVWLADGDALVLPPIGWGNQFQDVTLASSDACAAHGSGDTVVVAACRRWYAEQERYRRALRRLFVRQWQLAPALAVETFATPAYDALDADARRVVDALRPTAAPSLLAAASPGRGYQFEVLVPWTAFPPLRTLEVERLRVMVDVFRPGPGGRRSGPFATTSASRRWGDVTSFNAVGLSARRGYRVTPCAYPLRGYRAPTARYFGYGTLRAPDTIPTYVIPGATRDLSVMIGLENEARGYAYHAEGHSPIATPTTFFARPLGEGGLLCGPPLRYQWRGAAFRADSITLDSAVQVRRLPDGTFLLRSGPRVMHSYYGSGQCGGCPRVGLSLLHLDPERGVSRALQLFEIADVGSLELDLAVSAAWDTVWFWRERRVGDDYRSVWSLTTHCWDAAPRTYAVCATRDSVPEPNPRHLDLAGEHP